MFDRHETNYVTRHSKHMHGVARGRNLPTRAIMVCYANSLRNTESVYVLQEWTEMKFQFWSFWSLKSQVTAVLRVQKLEKDRGLIQPFSVASKRATGSGGTLQLCRFGVTGMPRYRVIAGHRVSLRDDVSSGGGIIMPFCLLLLSRTSKFSENR